MKRFCAMLVIAVLLGRSGRCYSQDFMNLNFESTTLTTNGPPGMVSTATGLPGWTASIGGVSQSTILYNDETLGNSAVAILGNGNSIEPVIAGDFSSSLVAGASGDAAISQSGLVPANAESIIFDCYSQGNGLTNLSVTLNGESINILPIETTGGYTVYGGNVSAFEGLTADLAFTATTDYPQGFEIFVLDGISFSPSPIPEPCTLALCALGGLPLVWRRWKESSA